MVRHLVINWHSPEECTEIMQENKIVCEGDMQVKASVVYQYKGALWKGAIDTIWGILTFSLIFISECFVISSRN